jgi:hypothetical protein
MRLLQYCLLGNCLVIALAIAAFIFGLAAAWYWWKSSSIEAEPLYPEVVKHNPTDLLLWQTMQLGGLLEAGKESARLNRIAAWLTAIAVALSTASTLVAALSPKS